ncbi:myo-inosose-2 dehydratase [Bartonella sp. HY329]|uniref:myo-inosose-2 dehydratase n=1 Tax=unclassified Bartonella TaxID=2645622 RepID=UPI0021C95BF3|nr:MULTISPECIES: myo-inosose-2 dehydratase [unclassified Bartonella]UXM94420.1 myo-inosose-2 dehydratase [Bartonella sp. HY329]UXN08744.1 myo-inosose-2 dehydratase [Bartonella sp. HY328]
MKARLGIAPIAWSNDDLPELGGQTTLDTCLEESAEAGFKGVETGGKFPKTAAALKPELDKYGLSLASGWYSGTVLDASDDLAAEKDKVIEQLELFRTLGAACLAYGETSGTIQNKRNAPLNTRRVLNEDEIKVYGRRLTKFAEFCADHGVPLGFHHHMGTAIESEHDLDLLMKHTGEAVGLLYDTGHMQFAGGDIYRTIKNHGSRIIHFHAKDLRMPVINSLDWSKQSFLDAVLLGAFTVPGDGNIDFIKVVQTLADVGYEGWFIVEAEQDPDKAPPAKMAQIGYDDLSIALQKAGYTIEEF